MKQQKNEEKEEKDKDKEILSHFYSISILLLCCISDTWPAATDGYFSPELKGLFLSIITMSV